MLLGYNTNGLAHHDPLDAIELLAELGYRSVALTIDHNLLNPLAAGLQEQCLRIRQALGRHGLGSLIETGARYLLDPRVPWEPTLMTADRKAQARRIEFLCRAIDIAAAVGAGVVSFWSGTLRDQVSVEEGLERLAAGLRPVMEHAAERFITLSLETRPGMFVDTTSRYERLLQWLGGPAPQLTLDVGHLYCQGELPIADYISRFQGRIANVHISDMRASAHEHRMFGDGEMDFPPIIAALRRSGYAGPVIVELDRHSYDGAAIARRAFDFLNPLVNAS